MPNSDYLNLNTKFLSFRLHKIGYALLRNQKDLSGKLWRFCCFALSRDKQTAYFENRADLAEFITQNESPAMKQALQTLAQFD